MSSDEAFYVLDGEMEFLLGDDRKVVSAGSLVLVPQGTTHTFATVGDGGAKVLVVMTPQVAALVEALHAPGLTPEMRTEVWARHHSIVVEG